MNTNLNREEAKYLREVFDTDVRKGDSVGFINVGVCAAIFENAEEADKNKKLKWPLDKSIRRKVLAFVKIEKAN